MNVRFVEVSTAPVPTVQQPRGGLWLTGMFTGIALFIAGLIVPFPGSVPRSWLHSNGTVASVVARPVNGAQRYYPTVQYLALGYSYEITSTAGYTYYPPVGEATAVAFNAVEPQQAKLVSETPTNYFQTVLPLAGIAFFLISAYGNYRLLAARRQAAEAMAQQLMTSSLRWQIAHLHDQDESAEAAAAKKAGP